MSKAKSGGSSKYGRNADKCKRYALEQRLEKSHIARIRKHIGKHPKDGPARDALKTWEIKLK